MYEKPGRYLLLTLVLILGACASMLLPERPFRMGLDLRGGTRLVYRFDFDRAFAEGKISASDLENRDQLLRDTADIITNRIDPDGLLEATIRPEGTERLVIELPGDAMARTNAQAQLGATLAADAAVLELDGDDETVKKFPVTGGVIGVGAEKIRYAQRDGKTLVGLERTLDGSAEHAAGERVRLLSDDAVRILIENTGDMQFFIGTRDTDLRSRGTDLATERGKLDAWIAAHPKQKLSEFNRLPTEAGGPVEGLVWFPMRAPVGEIVPEMALRRIEPLTVQPPEWRFSGDDLDSVGLSQDTLGYPAVMFELKPSKRPAFGDFTGSHVQDGMGIVLNDEIVTLATINEELPGQGIITGGNQGFKLEEVKDLITVLRSGSLRIRPELEQEERVGATLGDDYVRKGMLSSAVALALVIVFMVGIYRRLGFFAVVSLFVNLLLLLGVLAFLRATLTLPGIAGLILTVGMAVDSNILIYERIREERERGLKLAQAAKNGFERAFWTIFDTNITTLLSAVILLKLGTGPVKGFGTTLAVGILTSLFSVLVVTKLLVHYSLAKGASEFRMANVMTQTKVRWMAMARPGFALSLVAILASVLFFFSRPDREKLGIEFLGGFTLTARTEEPQSVDTIRSLIRDVPGTIGQSADVKAVLASGSPESGYQRFRITYKLGSEVSEVESASAQETGERSIREALASVLQGEAVQLTLEPAEAGARVSGQLAFDEAHPSADVAKVLVDLGLTDATVQDGAQPGTFTFSATAPPGADATELATLVADSFRDASDSAGNELALASPIPETSIVGSQVSGELRDQAVQALLLSLFVTVLYIRVRFKEYSYGIAVVAALVHDVLVAMGALTFANWLGFIQGEINLTMVAAFLTIIGWSQNDTIVIFDRVRENLPRVKGSFKDILDLSINQTLSRTILTACTTLLAVVVLFAFNVGTRNALEGFTFAMMVGIVSGTYSTIFIACPVLNWLETRAWRRSGETQDSAKAA